MIGEAILGSVILALVSGLIGKAIADAKYHKVEAKLTEMNITLVKIETMLIDIPKMKHDIESLYERLRVAETDVQVIKEGCKHHVV